MAKVTPARENYRVVIDAPSTWIRDTSRRREQNRIDCESMLAQVKRHVDDGMVARLEWDLVCPFCGYAWEAEPGCCDAVLEALAKPEEATR